MITPSFDEVPLKFLHSCGIFMVIMVMVINMVSNESFLELREQII